MSRTLLLLIICQLGAAVIVGGRGGDDGPATQGVARELALKRAAQISDLRYRLSLELASGAVRLKGREEIKLRLMGAADRLVLDFRDLDQSGNVIEGTV